MALGRRSNTAACHLKVECEPITAIHIAQEALLYCSCYHNQLASLLADFFHIQSRCHMWEELPNAVHGARTEGYKMM